MLNREGHKAIPALLVVRCVTPVTSHEWRDYDYNHRESLIS